MSSFSLDADRGQLAGSTENPLEGCGNTAKSQAAAFPAVNSGEQLSFSRTKLIIVFKCSAFLSSFKLAI